MVIVGRFEGGAEMTDVVAAITGSSSVTKWEELDLLTQLRQQLYLLTQPVTAGVKIVDRVTAEARFADSFTAGAISDDSVMVGATLADSFTGILDLEVEELGTLLNLFLLSMN